MAKTVKAARSGTPESRVAVVTGANRGLGRETTRQLAAKGIRVVATARDAAKGRRLVAELGREGLRVDFYPLDVTELRSIEGLVDYLKGEYGRCDILVNNAGILPDDQDEGSESAFNSKIETIEAALETNTFGPFRLIQRLAPLMREARFGRIVNVSSGMGQLSEMNGAYPAYRLSKTALNAVTRIFSEELQGTGVLVNSVCPGWVKTDMGGPEAELPVEEGADTIVWLATLPENGPSGGFFRSRQPIAW